MPIGPSRPLNLAKPESIDIRQAARYFGARGEADSATLTLLEKCAAPLLAAATPPGCLARGRRGEPHAGRYFEGGRTSSGIWKGAVRPCFWP